MKKFNILGVSQFAEGCKVPPQKKKQAKENKKKQSLLKSQFPPKMILLKSQQNFQTHLKSNFLFTPILNISLKRFSR